MIDILVAVILLIIVVLAVIYIRKEKKSGHKCIGCPNGCCYKQGGGSGCSGSCGGETH